MRRATTIAAAALLAAAPAGARAATFGSTLSKPPTDFDPPATCDTSGPTNQDLGPCLRVGLGYAATGAVAGRVTAPISGVIKRVRLRAGTPGAVRVTLVRTRNVDRDGGVGEAQVVSRGALLRVQGPQAKTPVETFPVNLRVHRGDYLALQGSAFSAMRCEGGNSEQLLFFPPPSPFADYQSAQGFDDCSLLVQAVVARATTKKAAAKKRS